MSQILLVNFRNYSQFHFKFSSKVTVFLGPNGIGKTNILEAINLLSLGDTFRDNKIEELVKLDQDVAHVGGTIDVESEAQEPTRLQLTLTRGVYQGKRVPTRRYQINDVGRLKPKFVGQLPSVCFRPEDMRIVEGSPARRRRFLDEAIAQVDRQYATSLATYSKALRSRNKLLEMIREGRSDRASLEYYNRVVLEHGAYLNLKRQEFVDFCNNDNNYKEFGLTVNYDHSLMNQQRLDQYKNQELAAGYTLVGPHRDDMVLKFQIQSTKSQIRKTKYENLNHYGSRGQQRMGVLWLKLMALEYMSSRLELGKRPLLLLDDIFSELDEAHRQLVFDLCDRQQTIITTADKHYLKHFKEAQVVDLESSLIL